MPTLHKIKFGAAIALLFAICLPLGECSSPGKCKSTAHERDYTAALSAERRAVHLQLRRRLGELLWGWSGYRLGLHVASAILYSRDEAFHVALLMDYAHLNCSCVPAPFTGFVPSRLF